MRTGNRCHECSDETRLRRNCTRPLRSSQFEDTRDASEPRRCPVEGYTYEGQSNGFDARFIARYWRAMDNASSWDRCTPDQVPADVDWWHRTVRAMYNQAEQWRKDALARKEAMKRQMQDRNG